MTLLSLIPFPHNKAGWEKTFFTLMLFWLSTKCPQMLIPEVTKIINILILQSSINPSSRQPNWILTPENLSQWRQPAYVRAVSRLWERLSLLYHLLDYFPITSIRGPSNTVVPLAFSYSLISTTTPNSFLTFTIMKL